MAGTPRMGGSVRRSGSARPRLAVGGTSRQVAARAGRAKQRRPIVGGDTPTVERSESDGRGGDAGSSYATTTPVVGGNGERTPRLSCDSRAGRSRSSGRGGLPLGIHPAAASLFVASRPRRCASFRLLCTRQRDLECTPPLAGGGERTG